MVLSPIIPGSGNTWVRHLLQLATGKQTGSIFHELRLKRNGFPGEGLTDGSVVAIKTHNLHMYEWNWISRHKFCPKIIPRVN